MLRRFMNPLSVTLSLPATVSVDSVQRFIRHNDLKLARDTNLRDRKAYEEDKFSRIWR